MELVYPGGSILNYTFTTDIQILPTFLPFAADIDFDGDIEGDVNGDGYVTLADTIISLQLLGPVTK